MDLQVQNVAFFIPFSGVKSIEPYMDLQVQNVLLFHYFRRSAIVSEQEDLPFLPTNPSPRREGGGGSLPPPKSRYDRTRETVAKIFVIVSLAGLLHHQDSDKDLRHYLAGGIIAPARQ